MSTTTTPPAVTPIKVKSYLVNLFDGIFSENQLLESRKYCFAKVAQYRSPTTGKEVSEVLSQEQIGEILNSLADAQFNRRMQAKASRMSEPSNF